MAIRGKIVLLACFIALTAASCGRGNATPIVTAIDQAAITTGIDFQNKAETTTDSISASTPSVYLSARITNPGLRTKVRVRWSKDSAILATEDFTGGQGGGGSQFDFEAGTAESYFASQVDRPGTSWPLGDYKVEILLNNKLYQTVGFKVVTDTDLSKIRAQNMVKRLIFGDRVDAQNQLLTNSTSFRGDTPHIYASVDLNQVPAGSNIEIAVRYVKDNLVVTSYKLQYQEGSNVTIELDGDQAFRKSRPNRAWPPGSYEVTVNIGGVAAKVGTFVVS